MYSSVVVGIFCKVVQPSPHSILEQVHYPQKKPLRLSGRPLFPSLQPQATTGLLSVSVVWPILDIYILESYSM